MNEMIMDIHSETLQLVVAAIVVLSTGLFVLWSRKTGGSTKLRLPPGPRGLPVLGSILTVGPSPHKGLQKLSEKYGPLIYLRMGSRPVLAVCDSAMMKEVLQQNDQVFASRPSFSLTKIITYGNLGIAFAPYGPHWRHVRKIMNFQLLTASKISRFSAIIEEEIIATVQLVLQGSESGKAVNVTNLFGGMVMNVLTQMVWRKRHCNISGSTQHETDRLTEILSTSAEVAGFNLLDFLPFSGFLMKISGWESKANAVHKDFDEFFEQRLCEREEQLSKMTETTTDDDDFLTMLLKLTTQSSADYGQISRSTLKAILVDVIAAGTDTTATTFDWTLAELMRHPDVMKKAQDELNREVGTNRLVTQADIPKLQYLGAIVKETLRRHGPVPLSVPHLSLADCKVGGFDVPENTLVLPNLYAIHHDPAFWDKPMEYNPDRFLDLDVDAKGQRFQFLPFGTGRRICPGMNLASNSLHLGVAQLLHAVDWSLPEGQTPESVDMTEGLGLTLPRAKPLCLIGKPRLSEEIISSAFPLR